MDRLTLAGAIGAIALLAATPSFANQQGGPDLTSTVPHRGAIADWSRTVQEPYIAPGDQPTVSVHALTGGPRSDPAEETAYGHFGGFAG
jgi:hypothetical protein